MTIDVNDVVRVVAEWDVPDGTIAQLVYHFIGISGASATDTVVLAALLAALDTAWLIIDQDISDVVFGSTMDILKWDFTNNRWDGVGQVAMANEDGTNTTDMVPHGAAALVKIFTAQARRQARKYIMGYCENNISTGALTVAALINIAGFAAALDNNVTAGALTLGFCTFNTDPTSPLFETASLASQAVQAEGFPGYQRRRRPGTGI